MDPIFFPNEQNALIKVSVPNPQKPTCFLLEMRAFPENRFTANFLKAYHQALDYVEDIMKSLPEEKKNIGGSLTTASTGKFYCNGLDVPYALRDKEVVPLLISLFSRLTVFRVPTVTAISGHAFGGGFVSEK
ncbi:hypothetical protein AX774_g4877 [Zancudomyces culisetae]|uniref:Uncharacterized protein n=1 Tax=Zancudomyces culisetae TaxID=1213189 RepID=A0A1R1PL22_ZANCU|nr:hypothetical protein AX774_g7919 [Zancudomyces culisetae]OMH81664.1 hypothetical protein AX774_g4877 [Zancudomyces culisetae]|eukprot:OMH78686.1 hypothetical protein AX774_g7919 [Zancudomyces culisetae]